MNGFVYSRWVHDVVTLIHISAALFWMGWVVFIFVMLVPVLRQRVPGRVQEILGPLKTRVRKAVLWLILLIVVTGLYNVFYNGLHRPEVLLSTSYGHRFLVKLGSVLILFFLYGSAPYLTGAPGGKSMKNPCSHDESEAGWIGVVLHGLVLLSGLTAAFLGLSLG